MEYEKKKKKPIDLLRGSAKTKRRAAEPFPRNKYRRLRERVPDRKQIPKKE